MPFRRPQEWPEGFWDEVEALRSTDDVGRVRRALADPRVPMRLAATEWWGFGDEHWLWRGISPVQAAEAFDPARPRMPDDVARLLLADRDVNVARCAALRAYDVEALVAVGYDEARDETVVEYVTERLLSLGEQDALLGPAAERGSLPQPLAVALARRSRDVELLSGLAAALESDPGAAASAAAVREALLENPALPAAALRRLLGASPVGRDGVPDGLDADAYWAGVLVEAADWLRDNSMYGNPGGFESSELRECGPAAGRLHGAAAPLCRAAASAVYAADSGEAPWVGAVITWACEIAAVTTGVRDRYVRMGVSSRHVTPAAIPAWDREEARRAADVLRTSTDGPSGLAAVTATFLDVLARDDIGSLAWLGAYGGGNGYDELHLFAIVVLATAPPALGAVLGASSTGE